MSYRPHCDTWILARPKVKFYGAFPNGFLHRAVELLGVGPDARVLHVCGGRVRDYPERGFGPNHRTVDLDPSTEPDYLMDVRDGLPTIPGGWDAVLQDLPYTPADAEHYLDGAGADFFPKAGPLLKAGLEVVKPGGRVGTLHYEWPRPPAVKDGNRRHWGIREGGQILKVRPVALVHVIPGWGNRSRAYSVFEKEAPTLAPTRRPRLVQVRPDVLALA